MNSRSESSRNADSGLQATWQLNEAELADRCLKRDWDSFDWLVRQYTKWVQAGEQRAKSKYAGNVSCDVEDLVQEFFLKLFDNPNIFKKYDSSRPLGLWLSGVAHHWSQEYLRSRAVDWRIRVSPEVCVEGVPCAEPAHEALDVAAIVAKVLKHLSSTTGDIMQARFGMGKYDMPQSVREIGVRLKMTESQVYHRLARIRRVRKLLRSLDLQEFCNETEK